MNPVDVVSGRVAVLDRPDVDTDQIIPKQFLKRIERTGYGDFLFFDWRFDEDGRERPGFELNREQFRGRELAAEIGLDLFLTQMFHDSCFFNLRSGVPAGSTFISWRKLSRITVHIK